MASVNCDICGARMGSFSLRKKVWIYKDSDEIEHYFCSEKHMNEWKKEHLPAPIESADMEHLPAPIESADMELLYHKKLDEYQVWISAISRAESDEESKEYKQKANMAKREVLKLAEILGKEWRP